MPPVSAPDGLLIVDKPADWTSHDVVARCRRLAGTRKVGHAGTLDPLATGVLVLGIGRATRLLGHLSLATKAYTATIRLGQTTLTDDSQAEVLASVDASGVSDAALGRGVAALTGDLMQVPSSVSAVKVNGERAYKRARSGEEVALPARPVTVSAFDIMAVDRHDCVVDVEVRVECTSGTYIRALARDLGRSLGVGGHLTALRRTRVGPYGLDACASLDHLASLAPEQLPVEPLDAAARSAFAWCVVEESQVPAVRNGRAVTLRLRDEADAAAPTPAADYPPGARRAGPGGPVALLAPGGQFLALYEQHGPVAKAVAVFAPA